MKIISGTTEFHIENKSAVAIGKFDGVHLGHQKLLRRMHDWQAQGYPAVVFTFDRPPASVFSPEKDIRELTTPQEKRELMERMGADVLVEFPMTTETAAMPPEVFVEEILAGQLNSTVILAGEDLSFGHQGRGNRRLLEAMAPRLGYRTEIVDKLSVREALSALSDSVLAEETAELQRNKPAAADQDADRLFHGLNGDTPVSSTLVRSLLEEGRMEQVTALCGRPYSVSGSIIHGRHLGGPVLQMPTINMEWPAGKLAPPFGVYYSRTLLEGKYYRSVTNVGRKPTVSEENRVLAETYIYDFEGNAYGERARVFLYGYKRPERKFDGIEALREQMQRDIREGADYWES
ncbi:MAG: bifunctional riboflavin kinase/FMN adenylyltransferase [Lachnospiraceae bacterium]|nr:bifunctional riboflavin kinase/FMN adenylyltransferase [Lachnospiraceae bacterium]